MRLVWFRNDLRINMNTPLAEALASGDEVVALYLLCPRQWDAHFVAPIRRWYLLQSLFELGQALALKGVCLHVLDAGDFDQVADVLVEFSTRHQVTDIYCNRDYPLNELRRDRKVAQRLRDEDIAIHGFDDGMLVPPSALRTGKGAPYSIYTPYRRRWRVWLEEHARRPVTAPEKSYQPVAFLGEGAVLEALKNLQVDARLTASWSAGERAALMQLSHFVDAQLPTYKTRRDSPDEEGTSLLSTALSVGTLAPYQAWTAARERTADPACRDGAECWIGELAWRDFYRQIMHHFPLLAAGRPFRPETDLLPWSYDETLFSAWCEGRTGYPLVDAAMRQLTQTGWMHNRLRMVTAMFLSKHLFIDWRKGERFFMQHLIDGDVAANNGGWQWCASTGTDAVPYFRVFNPTRQSQRFDPEGRFIKRFLPELAALDAKGIHEPWKQPWLAPDYPPPIVEHQGVKQRVEAAFRAAKSDWNRNQQHDGGSAVGEHGSYLAGD